MRNAFASEITNLAEKNEKIILLSGDIGNRLFDNYKMKFKDRFFNCGVAEANMTGIAAGMALCGLKPVTYTITPFNTARCFEQIRIDVCYQNLPVIIVGVGAGLSYASLGSTHHSFEDIAILRSLPNMTIICPGDALEVRCAIKAALDHDGPVYIRIGKKNEPLIHKELDNISIGKGIVIREGKDLCILSTGNVLPIALETSQLLEQRGIFSQVISMHTVKPLDELLLRDIFNTYKIVVTIEEHSLIGGFGSSIIEWQNQNNFNKNILKCFGLPDKFLKSCGNQADARKLVGLTPENITEKILLLKKEN